MTTQPRTTPPAAVRPGWVTSEFSTLLGAWLGVQAMPEHLVWPTVAVACTYIFSRAVSKAGTCRGHAAPEELLGGPTPPPPAAPQQGTLGFAQGIGRAAVLCLALAVVPGCQALQELLAQPVGQGEVTVVTPTGEPVTGTPEPQPAEPVTVPLPEGLGEATYTPPTPPAQPTVGSELGGAVGGIVGAVTGQPALGAVLSLVLTGLAARAAGRRKGGK